VLRERPLQALASSYIGAFQLPWLPERALAAFDHALLRRGWRAAHLRPGAFTAAHEEAYVQALGREGALEAAIAYYRALSRHGARVPGERRVLPHETLLVWGMRDPALLPENAEKLERWVPRLRVVRVPEAGHWVMADAPEATNAALLDLFRS
jgi:pimeloyl-ACP methyl ester carboxylesterase